MPHDEDADTYLNGNLVQSVEGDESGYTCLPWDAGGLRALRNGENSLAVHCRQTPAASTLMSESSA